jgi:acetylornithine deacetylase/succinyl-diaminopimelate desuccinylase-like protein
MRNGNRSKALPFVLLLSFMAPCYATDRARDPVALLQEYLRIDTVNPPGNEVLATNFLAGILSAEGIAYETAESAPGRVNLWARLEGGDKPGLLLLHHTDVVPADSGAWTVPPLGGELRDGYVYGRGALDMKSQGIMHLLTFIALHRSGRSLNRDVVFMATADEENGSAMGMGWMITNRPDAFRDIGFTITEGGGGVVVNEQKFFGVEVAQKYPLWLKIEATGTPGHGSTPRSDAAVDRLLDALDSIREYPFEAHIIPAVDAYFKQLASQFPGKLGAAFADIRTAVTDEKFNRNLKMNIPQLFALTRNTCAITRLAGSDRVNTQPAKATAELDCRLLPDQDSNAFIALLQEIIASPAIRIEPTLVLTPASSAINNDLYAAIEDVLSVRYPGVNIGPSVSTGFTDSHHLRKRDIVSYGFTPALIPLEDYGGIHGNNERISVDTLREGTLVLQEIINSLVYGNPVGPERPPHKDP